MGKRNHQVTLIPGDWIGPETCEVVKAVVAASGVHIDWQEQHCSDGHYGPELLESCRQNKVILKAKLDSQRIPGRLPPTIQLRKDLQTWATIRPIQAMAGIQARFPDIDLVVIRETSEDIYSGLEHEVSSGVYEAVKVTTRAACERIARFAFEYAVQHNRHKVTIVHKSNIMKKSDGLFLKTALEIGQDYRNRGITTEEVIVDALCMRLVRWPMQFDVLLTGNLFGDIISDLASGLAGGIMASPSYSLGDNIGLFENPHGRAPELVGTGKANPIPMLLTSVQMLRYLGEQAAASRIQGAIQAALQGGLKTIDQGGTAGCKAVQEEVIRRLAGTPL